MQDLHSLFPESWLRFIDSGTAAIAGLLTVIVSRIAQLDWIGIVGLAISAGWLSVGISREIRCWIRR